MSGGGVKKSQWPRRPGVLRFGVEALYRRQIHDPGKCVLHGNANGWCRIGQQSCGRQTAWTLLN